MSARGEGQPSAAPPPAADVKVDVRERGANQLTADRRLFIQLLVYGGCADSEPLVAALESRPWLSVAL